VAVGDVEADHTAAGCAKIFVDWSQKTYPKSKNYNVRSEKMIQLNEGTEACEAITTYFWSPTIPLKDGKWIEISSYGSTAVGTEKLVNLTHSFKIE